MLSSRKTSAPSTGVTPLLTKSLRFRSSASAYLSRTPSGAGSSTSFTFSTWVKRGTLGIQQNYYHSGGANANGFFGFTSTNTFSCLAFNSVGANYAWYSTMVFTDPSSWYHIVIQGFASSSGNSYGGVELALYVNGVQRTFTGSAYGSPTTTNRLTDATAKQVGADITNALYYDGLLADFYYVDGQSLTPSSFASTNATTGQWSPAKYSGTYGTNGFHLTFANTTSTTTLGYDTSGNSNNWTTTGISLSAGSTYDSMNDVPVAYSATASNYCVLNPNDAGSGATVSNGNLGMSCPTGTYNAVRSTFQMNSGKWYWEATLVTSNGSGYENLGIANPTFALNGGSAYVGATGSYGYQNDGTKYGNGTSTPSYGASFTSGDVIGVAFDSTNGSLTFYKNNTSQGVAFTGITSGLFFPAISGYGSTWAMNFGQQGFKYTPPSGYNALNTYNLPTPAIAQGNAYMNAVLQLGSAVNTGANLFAQSGYTYGLAWGKDRTSSNNNQLVDTVRGTSNVIQSNTTSAETTYSAPTSSDNCVAWVWNAQNASGANSNGSITSTVSVSTTAGFSIVTYTGTGSSATVGHGLGVAPTFFIIKKRSSTGPWTVWTTGFTVNQYLLLNTTSTIYTFSNQWSALPTSTVLGLNTDVDTNGSGLTFVAYCFAPVAGFSSFGSYSGNSSNQFIYTGFQPKWVMIKLSGPSGGGSWTVFDTSRSPYNLEALRLQPNSSNAEASTGSNGINGLSNGFQLVGDYNGGDTNLSGYTYIYAAFASNPFAYSNAF